MGWSHCQVGHGPQRRVYRRQRLVDGPPMNEAPYDMGIHCYIPACETAPGPPVPESAPIVVEPAWQAVEPPEGCAIVLPSSLAGQYKLLLPAVSQRGRALHWGFEGCDREGPDARYYRALGGRHRLLQEHQVPRVTRAIGYYEPPFLLDWPEGRRPKSKETEQVGPGWSVFHSTGPHGETHTIVAVQDTLVEITPETIVHITETTPERWLSKDSHRGAIWLGEKNPRFAHCYLAYTDVPPSTHILVGRFAIHMHEPRPIGLTVATEGKRQEIC